MTKGMCKVVTAVLTGAVFSVCTFAADVEAPAKKGKGRQKAQKAQKAPRAKKARAVSAQALMGALVKETVLMRLDANQDGKLDEAEQAAVNEKWSAEQRNIMKEMTEKHGQQPQAAEGKKARGKRIGPDQAALVVADLLQANHADLVKKFDADADGTLGKDEIQTGAAEIHKAVNDKINSFFDANGDGKLDNDEKAAMQAAFRRGPSKKVLEKFDKDGDGKLSKEERQAMQEEAKKQAAERKAKGGRKGKGGAAE